MNEEELLRFISHYQRLTKHALASLPVKADWLLQLDKNHRIISLDSKNERTLA